MPPRTPKACRYRGCSQTTTVRNGYCSEHQQSGWQRSSTGKTRTQRGYGASWDKQRKRIFSRDNYLCQNCLKEGKLTPATEVDHIIPKSQGGTDEDDNLQSICIPCHRHKTATERHR